MQFNGQNLSADAHAIAKRIEATSGLSYLSEAYNIANVKTDLRRLYTATGGERKTAANADRVVRDPTASEYKAIFNGRTTGAAVLAKITGKPVKTAAAVEAPAVVTDEPATDAEKLAKLLAGAMGGQKVDPDAVKAMAVKAVDNRVDEIVATMDTLIEDAVGKAVRRVEIVVAEMPPVTIDTHHNVFEDVVLAAANRENVLLVGPAGSGKTTLARQVAEALGLEFHFTGKVADETKLTGFIDAGGTYRTTAFRKAYEFGGVFLFDEMDGSSPDALVAFNAPLAGDIGDFPDGQVSRHKDFVAIAAANTFGRGADRQYVGREQLDAATLDRFAVIEMDYDEELELALSCNTDWAKYVQKVRGAVAKEKVRHVVSPRASIAGGKMLKAGMDRAKVEEMYIWKGLDEPVRNRVKASMR